MQRRAEQLVDRDQCLVLLQVDLERNSCVVILMTVTHIVLGQSQIRDRRVKNDAEDNTYSLICDQCEMTLVPQKVKESREEGNKGSRTKKPQSESQPELVDKGYTT